ncbi:MAG TPA: heat-inducible transcriptional repressor HrcA [Anaerolineae bacterium]
MDEEYQELTPRQQTILNLIVHTYVATAAPVSSRALLEAAGINVSSDTVRNDMALLEELGFLTHPHTSAGRIPTDKGYRYFVERLLGDVELPTDERNTIRHQFHQAKLEMSQWMQLAAAVLARSARGAALVTAPQLDQPRIRHLELISTQSHLVLLILVLQGGNVRQRILTLKEPMDQAALSQAATKLNNVFDGMDFNAIRTKIVDLSDFEADVRNLLTDFMADGTPPTQDVYRDGLTEVLQQPEFISQSDARALVNAMEEPNFLKDVLSSRVGTVQVVIGGEGRWRELSACSMVLARYGVEGFATGTVGVLGPTRMPYGRAISTVRYVADLMSDLVSDLYAD